MCNILFLFLFLILLPLSLSLSLSLSVPTYLSPLYSVDCRIHYLILYLSAHLVPIVYIYPFIHVSRYNKLPLISALTTITHSISFSHSDHFFGSHHLHEKMKGGVDNVGIGVGIFVVEVADEGGGGRRQNFLNF